MAIIRVTTVTEFEIDTDKYVAAAIEAETLPDDHGLDNASHTTIAQIAVDYNDAEDNLPCWARDSIRVISQSTGTANP